MEQIASHSEEVQEEVQEPKTGLTDEQYANIMQELGYSDGAQQKPSDAPDDDLDDESETDEQEPPATEEQKNVRRVKFNKREVEIPEDQIEEYLQKGLALEKERERKTEAEKALQRAAKLAGYDKVDDYLANLDKIEQDAVKRQQDYFSELKKQLIAEAEEHGFDPELFNDFLENNPLVQQANEVLSKQQKEQDAIRNQEAEQASVKAWEALFEKYPSLHEQMSADGATAPWMTEAFIEKINRGYDPIDAYELVHKESILAEERKRTEQAVKKQNRLNKRAKVEGVVPSEIEDDVPENIKGAFAQFGLDPRTAKNFMTRK